MKAENEPEGKQMCSYLMMDLLKGGGNRTSTDFSNLHFPIMKRTNAAVCPLPLFGTFLFRIPKQQHTHELKDLIREHLQNFSSAYSCQT